jgi:hypothetical protein
MIRYPQSGQVRFFVPPYQETKGPARCWEAMIFKNDSLDPAAVFACAISLRDACVEAAKQENFNLSEAFNGADQFYREVVRIAGLFEEWACTHVAFDEMSEVWPYLLEDKFGDACLQRMSLQHVSSFSTEDCANVAMLLVLPLFHHKEPRLPIDLRVPNPVTASPFTHWRIQSVRSLLGDEDYEPMNYGDDPFDPEYDPAFIALYGVNIEGLVEHIKDFASYADAVSFVSKIAPDVEFPAEPIVSPPGR